MQSLLLPFCQGLCAQLSKSCGPEHDLKRLPWSVLPRFAKWSNGRDDSWAVNVEFDVGTGAGFCVDATEPRWSAAPVQAVFYVAPGPVVEYIALAVVVYAAPAPEVEYIAAAPAVSNAALHPLFNSLRQHQP